MTSIPSGQKTSSNKNDKIQSQSQNALKLSLKSKKLTAGLMQQVLGNDKDTNTKITQATTVSVQTKKTNSVIPRKRMWRRNSC